LSNRKQSKLELYVEVLKTLGEEQSLNLAAIEGKTKIERSALVLAMDFLEKQNMIEPIMSRKDVLYKNTPRGVRVFRYLCEAKISNDELNMISFSQNKQ
jgi:DNA-binding MarR family transcriptional regulator